MNDDPGSMEIVGFGFTEARHADAAETELRRVLDVEDGDLSSAEVGGDSEFVNGYRVVLAGRIREHRVAQATEVVGRYGGEVLTEVPEDWATPRPAADHVPAIPVRMTEPDIGRP